MEEYKTGRRILNRDIIKYIAMAAMLLNHIAKIILRRRNRMESGCLFLPSFHRYRFRWRFNMADSI